MAVILPWYYDNWHCDVPIHVASFTISMNGFQCHNANNCGDHDDDVVTRFVLSTDRRSVRTGNDVRTQIWPERISNGRGTFRRRVGQQGLHMRHVAGRCCHGVRATGVRFSHGVAQLPAPVSHKVRPIHGRVHHAQRRPVFGLLQVSKGIQYSISLCGLPQARYPKWNTRSWDARR